MKIRYNIKIDIYELDLLKTETHENFIKNLKEIPSIIICAVGLLGEQKENENSLELRTKVIRTNYEGPINIISDFANIFENQGYGTIVGISSVAGDRGKASNYIYGSSKAGLSEYLSGLRQSNAKKKVHICTLKPGFVYTKMTKDLSLPPLLTSTSDKVGRMAYKAYVSKSDIVYISAIWKYIMLMIKCIPEFIFKRIRL